MQARVDVAPYGRLPGGIAIDRYSIANGAVELDAISYGAHLTALRVPDRNGILANVVLGYDALDGYLHSRSYVGALVGRYANRIAGGRFQLDGVVYQLDRNDGANHLHGGRNGFDRQVWVGVPAESEAGVGVRFSRTSPDGEEGYPGTLEVSVTYLLSPRGTVSLEYEAITDARTIVNLTQHTYFNLQGEAAVDTRDHVVTIHAERFTPVAAGLVPTGTIALVRGTPLDFTNGARFGDRLTAEHAQLAAAGGFDFNYVIDRSPNPLAAAAELYDPRSGRRLTIATTEPGLQFYGGHLLGRAPANGDREFVRYGGVCLETQHFPDSPNRPAFPSATLAPGAEYRSRTEWSFTAE